MTYVTWRRSGFILCERRAIGGGGTFRLVFVLRQRTRILSLWVPSEIRLLVYHECLPHASMCVHVIACVQAVEYLQQAVVFDDKDGHTWEELAYCYLMINDLQNSYTAYQHALYHIQNPKVHHFSA